MTDPLRSDRPATPADLPERDRDARVEHLLLAGLDHYFAGQYELAISVWTRVLFLNHGHARARAYMERARSAISERQRESEELLHTGVEAFGRGDVVAARRLLTSAVERGAATEEALALLDRLNRLEAAGAGSRDTSRKHELARVGCSCGCIGRRAVACAVGRCRRGCRSGCCGGDHMVVVPWRRCLAGAADDTFTRVP